MAEADQVSSDVSEDGIVKSRLSSYFPREYAGEERHVVETQRDSDPRRDVASQQDVDPNPWESNPVESNPVIDRGPLPADNPAPVPAPMNAGSSAHGDNGNAHEETLGNTPEGDPAAFAEPAIKAAAQPKTTDFAVRPVPPRFAPSEPHFEMHAEPDREPVPTPAAPPPSLKDQTPSARRHPVSEETLASIVAGRTFDTDEAERAFLLTLSRDQRLKYAELLHADEQLEFDVQRHNLRLDQLDFERERIEAAERTRRSEHAFLFANQAIRILLVLNGLAAIVVLGVWGYLAAAPGARFVGNSFEQAVWALGLGTLTTVLTALSSYVAQALMAVDDKSRMWYWLIVGTRGFGIFLAVAGFLAFLFGLSLASYGLSAD